MFIECVTLATLAAVGPLSAVCVALMRRASAIRTKFATERLQCALVEINHIDAEDEFAQVSGSCFFINMREDMIAASDPVITFTRAIENSMHDPRLATARDGLRALLEMMRDADGMMYPLLWYKYLFIRVNECNIVVRVGGTDGAQQSGILDYNVFSK